MPIFPKADDFKCGEPHNRFCVIQHRELPSEHKAEYRINGIDPDTLWSMVWSFDDEETAIEKAEEEMERSPASVTYGVIDLASSDMCLGLGNDADVMERFWRRMNENPSALF